MKEKKYAFDLQAHRGGASMYPENSIPAFMNALELNVNTLELDVIISKDSKVVVSHEAHMNPSICLQPNGDSIPNKESFNLYKMNYKDIEGFDCGSLGNPRFLTQKKLNVNKPLLDEVLQMVKINQQLTAQSVNLNIELKSLSGTDNIYHPEPEEFVKLVVRTIRDSNFFADNIILQSFDVRIIDVIHQSYPEFKTAFLVDSGNFQSNMSILKSPSSIYSPYYELVDSLQVKQAHEMGMKVIPWTVNDFKEMQALLEMGVDGLITDYPNLAKALHKH